MFNFAKKRIRQKGKGSPKHVQRKYFKHFNLILQVILYTNLLTVPNHSQASTIEALLQRKWKISNTLSFCREQDKVVKALQVDPSLRREFCSSLLESNWDQIFPTISKKSSLPHCDCEGNIEYIDLGREFYPRKIPQRKCTQARCCPQPWVCREVIYTMKVLRLRDVDEDEDQLVPSPLNHCWSFKEVNITVACQCKLQGQIELHFAP